MLGIGQEGLRKIAVDDDFRMDPHALAAAIREDRAAGWTPFAVTATVGTTSTTSIDPVPEIAEVCARERLWLHVDAAYAGSAAVAPELRGLLRGCERADSLVMNPHKWLFVPVDLSALYTRRPEVMKAAFSLVPEYLRTAEESVAPNLMDYGVTLGRRFRALKLWMVIRAFGQEGLAARIREHVRLAQALPGLGRGGPRLRGDGPDPALRRLLPLARGRRLRRRRGPGNEKILDSVNLSGEAYLSHTKLDGRTVLRLAIGNIRTEERHVKKAWDREKAVGQIDSRGCGQVGKPVTNAV